MPKKSKNPAIDHFELIKLYRKALVDDVPLDKIEKKVEKLLTRSQTTERIEEKEDQKKFFKLMNKVPRFMRVGAYLMPLFLIIAGVLLVGSAVVPILGFYVNTLPELNAKKLAAPIPREQVLDVTPLIVAQARIDDPEVLGEEIEGEYTGPIILDAKLDFTNLANWFQDASLPELQKIVNEEEVSEYVLEIPKLKITSAKVKVGGTDLNKNLIHYHGTALPGKLGSGVIFGHSVLRQFYNPKESNSRRYNSIFSTIMTLNKGDKIYVTVGNIKYTYMVQDKTEVKPTDTYILAQRYDSRQLKLVTCVPEGTYLRRGVVTAQLIKE